ncbi:MAG: nucleotidyltransferase family protein [Acidobacteriota bacterium]|nr:nucleotidyltransferase family protein [Acidobacteriota bacterium]
MKAMVLAAGLGTRLRPLTNDRPKALVEIAGKTLLEITLARLRVFGVRDVIVNVHHFADVVVDYLHAHDNFGFHIEISREEELLDTGGGLKKAAWFFTEGADADEPFLVHNVDVVSGIDLAKMVSFHLENDALATLAVQKRETSRLLLFDGEGVLCGRRSGAHGAMEMVRRAEVAAPLAFAGIHVLSPRIFTKLHEEGAFSIIPAYLRLAAEGERICAFRADEYAWRDVGRPDSIRAAEQEMRDGGHGEQ